jgi:hypothetical protein
VGRRLLQFAAAIVLMASNATLVPQTPAYASVAYCTHFYQAAWPAHSYLVSFKGQTSCTVSLYEMIGDTTVYSADYRTVVAYGNHFDCFTCLSDFSSGSHVGIQNTQYHLQYRWDGYAPYGLVWGVPPPACFNATATHQICNFFYDYTFVYNNGYAPTGKPITQAGSASSALR